MTTEQKTATIIIATEPMVEIGNAIASKLSKGELAQLALYLLDQAGMDVHEQFRVLEVLVLEGC